MELDEELKAHLEMLIEDNVKSGMNREEARLAALREFGSVSKFKEECQDSWRVNLIENFIKDLRYGIRMLRKNPWFTGVAVLMLGLGIGANTAIFSFLDCIFLRPLSVKEPQELVILKHRSQTGYEGDGFIYPFYLDLRQQSQPAFSELIAYSLIKASLSVENSEAQVVGLAVSSDYFSTLGVRPRVGRTFLPEEGQAGSAHPVAMISHGLWQRRFDGDPEVVGKTIRLNGRPLTVVGVAPHEFAGTYVGLGPSVYLPLGTWARIKGVSLDKRSYNGLQLIGRLKPGVSREQAQAALRVLAEQIHAVEPVNSPTGIFLTDGSRGTNMWTEKGLWLSFALVQFVTALILLVACANVINLLLARGITRQKEMAIRVALGAGRSRVIRQMMAESTLLALLGGACGVLLAQWLTSVLRGALTLASWANMPVRLDARILVFGLLASMATALACGLAPALRTSRPNLLLTLNEGSGVLRMLTGRWSLRNLMVVTQVAITMIILAFGALCVRSLAKVRIADPGYDVTKILAAAADFKRQPGGDIAAYQLFADLRERLAALPPVEAVCLAAKVPLTISGRRKTGVKRIDDFQMPPDKEWLSLDYSEVSPGYFETLGVPLLRGRDFTSRDSPGAPKVMIVNELFAQHYWPNQNPIGKRVSFSEGVREVIGVVKTVKLHSIQAEPLPLMFWPIVQTSFGKSVGNFKPVLLVRTTGDPKALDALVRQDLESAGLAPAALDVRTLSERIAELLTPQRMITGLLNVVGLVGLLFAATGIFSVMAYEVNQRTREIGIRVALGAQWRDVRELILRKGAALTLAGLGLGICLSLAPMWLLVSLIPEFSRSEPYRYFLYGVRAWDPLTYAGAALAVVMVALAASWFPARKATKVEPMVALRYE